MTPERKSRLLAGLDVCNLEGLELGPLADPALLKQEGSVVYIDRVSTAELRSQYLPHGLPPQSIVDVDLVWRDGALRDLVNGRAFDFVVASHVIEHVPDPIAWLRELSDILKPGGTLCLAIPDKRFCFDYLRAESRVSDLLAAYVLGSKRPSVQQVIDSELHHRLISPDEAWSRCGEAASRPGLADLERALIFADRANAGEYVDVHCWSFTPSCFLKILRHLSELSLLDLSFHSASQTTVGENEFFVSLSKNAKTGDAADWPIVKGELDAEAAEDLRPQIAWLKEKHEREMAALKAEVAVVKAEVAVLEVGITRFQSSTSWRITEPLRALAGVVKRMSSH